MLLVTVQTVKPLGIWVEQYPVVLPFFDSVYAPATVAEELAEEWATDLLYLKTKDYDYMVYLPEDTRYTVEWCADRLGWR